MKNKYRAHPILTFFFCLALLAGFAPAVLAEDNVPYIGADGNEMFQSNVTEITPETTALPGGWYVVNGEVNINQRVTATGDVHLILADGANLTINGGIQLEEGNSLTIYRQSDGTGTLNATGNGGGNLSGGSAGIGGVGSYYSTGGTCGSVTIYGGTVTARGGSGGTNAGGGAGIGGGGGGHYGTGGSCGSVTIYGGTVNATGGSGGWLAAGGAGIGGGGGGLYSDGGGSINAAFLYGGIVTATGGSGSVNSGRGADIGGGGGASYDPGGSGGTILILTSQLTATNIGGGFGGFGAGSGAEGQGIRPGSSAGTFEVYGGEFTLPSGITLDAGETLTIPENTTLDVNGQTVNNAGTVYVYGTLSGSIPGDVRYPSTVTVSISGDGVTGSDGIYTAPYGAQVTITATMAQPTTNALTAALGTVDFYLGDVESGTLLGSATVTNNNGTYTATLTLTIENTEGRTWNVGSGTNTLTADFGGVAGGTTTGLISNTDTAQLTVNKADQITAPDAPTQNGTATADTITLNEVTGTEGYGSIEYGYTTGGGDTSSISNWQTSTEFTGLTAGTAYTFYARYAGNDFYNSSPASEGKTIYTAYAAPEDGEGYKIDLTTETITIDSSYEVNTAQDFNGTSITSGTSLVNYVGQTLFIRHVGDVNGAPASEVVKVTIPGRANTPSYPTVTATTTDSITIRTETGVEYRLGENGAWQPGSGQTLTFSGLEPGKQYSIYARRPATDSTFASAALKLDVTTASASSGSAGGSSASGTPSGTSSPSGAAAQQATPYYTCPACGTHNWTATAEGYRCDNCGHIVTAQLSGYGNVKGRYDPATASGTAANAASAIPQTGDSSEPALWAVVCLLSAGALMALGAARRRRQ